MTRTVRISGRRLLGVAAIVIAALSASACGPVQAGSAAIVGDRRISVAALQTATTELQDFEGASAQVGENDVLRLMIIGPYLVKAAAAAGVGISTDQVIQAFKSRKVLHPSSAAVATLRAAAALNSMEQAGKQQEFQAAVREINMTKITVNPRYGRFDPKTVNIVVSTPDWLVTPTPTPTPSGAGQSPTPTP